MTIPFEMTQKFPFDKILILNRGEIACRIMKTIKNLNLKSCSIYSLFDQNSLHVKLSDESHLVKSYLDKTQIIDICNKFNIKCVHPGKFMN